MTKSIIQFKYLYNTNGIIPYMQKVFKFMENLRWALKQWKPWTILYKALIVGSCEGVSEKFQSQEENENTKYSLFGRKYKICCDLCIFIGPRSDHSLPMSVTHWLSHKLVEDLMNWPKYVDYADQADYAKYAEYAEYAE